MAGTDLTAAASASAIDPPRESVEQKELAKYLDALGLNWFHAPNERNCSGRRGAEFQRQGVKPGVPDVLIVDRPPKEMKYVGTAIELKCRRAMGKRGKLLKGEPPSENQVHWINVLQKRGWFVAVCHGADEAIEVVQRLGYERYNEPRETA